MSTELINLVAPTSQYLARTRFFRGMSEEHLDAVVVCSQLMHYGEGEVLYSIGDMADNLYVLCQGKVRFAIGDGPSALNTGVVLKPGELFGWAAMLEANVRIATATCLSPTAVLAFDGACLKLLMESDPRLGYVLMKRLNNIITSSLTGFAAG